MTNVTNLLWQYILEFIYVSGLRFSRRKILSADFVSIFTTEVKLFFPNRDVILYSFGIDSIHIQESYKALKL